MSTNWYIVLELEFDPNPVHDLPTISAKIDEKVKFWARNFNDFQHGAAYRDYHDRRNEITAAMANETERKRLVAEACKITFGPIDDLIKMVGMKGNVTQAELQNIATRQKVAPAVVERRRAALGIPIVAGKSVDYQPIYDKYIKTKPQNASTFDGLNGMLATFNAANLYEFLFQDTPTKNASKLPCETLKQKAAELKKNEFNKADARSGSGGKLCSQCELSFANDANKAIYDSYLEYNKRKAIFDDVKGAAAISGEISDVQFDVFVGRLTEVFKDRKLATEVLEALCNVDKIKYDPGGKKEDTRKLIVCRICGLTNDASDGRKLCQSCGAELYIKCPKQGCGIVNEASVNVCKCGFRFENLDKANALCTQAEASINALDFDLAESHLVSAERYWPGYSMIADIRKTLAQEKQRLEPLSKPLKKAVEEKRFFEAKSLYTKIQNNFQGYKNEALELEIKTALDTAATALKQAQAAKAEKDIIDACVKAYEACADYPGVNIPPPAPPTNLRIAADATAKANNLGWEKSPSIGTVTYTVLRKRDVVPMNAKDGEVLGQVSACGFNDKNIQPAVNYFYAVFAERAGTPSPLLVSSAPTANLFEVSNLSITPGNAMLQLEWGTLPPSTSVEVFRKNAAGQDEKISSTSAITYLDSGLTNGKTYTYTVRLVYNVGGRPAATRGLSISGTPDTPMTPVDSLSVKPGDGDIFTATWSNMGNVNVELYCSPVKPNYAFGETVSQQAFEKNFSRLALNRINSTTATFQHKGDQMLYVVATVSKSGSVTIGAVARASKGGAVKVNRIAAVNDKINIFLDVPPGATGFVVLYRFDKFPEDITDTQTVRKYIPLKSFQHYGAIIIDSAERRNHYFTVFAEFKRDDESDYSSGTDYLYSTMAMQTITYSITVSKPLFGTAQVILDFEADGKMFELPDIDIVSSPGRAPMFKKSAQPFYAIDAQTVRGSLQVKIPFPKGLPRDTHIKAFVRDDALAANFPLKFKLGSNYKIS